MTNSRASDPLLQPLQLKTLTLKNRIMSTSHAMSYEEEGMPKDRYQRYHEAKAQGGIALTMFGGSSVVSRDSPSVFGQLDLSDDRVVPWLQTFSERIHRHDTALMCQISHMGRRSSSYVGDWLPTIAPSRSREFLHRSFAREMDRADIARVVADYAAAARRCEEGGLDGVEVLAGGHLVGQFMSPLVNKRGDDYGGSIANRARFGLEVLEAIRGKVGNDFVVSLRMTMEEGGDSSFSEVGLSNTECREFAKVFDRSGFVDVLNLVYGRTDSHRSLAETQMPGMTSALGPYVAMAQEFRADLTVPIFHATRIPDLATARHVISSGAADMVGMTRAHIADPNLIRKLLAGQEEQIRPCVGAAYCTSPRRTCIHNPVIGRERTLPHSVEPAEVSKRVVVVGGGPAGLEAARICGERGHSTTLFEAGPAFGGQLALAARAPLRRDLKAIVDWRVGELARLGVETHLSTMADDADIVALDPDVVIVATGGQPDLGWLAGHELVVSTWDVLSGNVRPPDTALVFDATGQNQASSAVDMLSQAGTKVELVTHDSTYGAELNYVDASTYRSHLYGRGVTISTDLRLRQVHASGDRKIADLVNTFTDAMETREVDMVVVETGTTPTVEVFNALRPQSRNDGRLPIDAFAEARHEPIIVNPDGLFDLFLIGDAVTSRDAPSAFLDATRLCVNL